MNWKICFIDFVFPVPRLPTIETIENCMKLSPMIVQGLWEYKSPLLQLPYITEDHLKYFTNRKKHIKSLLQLAQLPGEERRQVLRFLNDKQYDDLMKVLGNMPYIHFQVNTEGNKRLIIVFLYLGKISLFKVWLSPNYKPSEDP